MNKVIILGRLTRSNELRHTNGAEPLAVLANSIAVNRIKKGETDFINIKAFGKTAGFIKNYFSKGKMILIEGRIQTGSYDKDGTKIYTTDVIVEKAYFTGEKAETNKQEIEEDDDINLPF